MRPSRRQGAGADRQHIRTLNAARLAADVEGVPTVLLCRTDAHSAQLLTSDVDERDRPFISDERTPEGFFRIRPGLGVEYAIARSLAYRALCRPAVVGDQRAGPGRGGAFADAIHRAVPGQDAGLQLLARASTGARSCRRRRSPASSATSARMGYKFQFVTLAGFHSLNLVDVRPGARLSGARHGGLLANCSRPSSPPRPRATPRRATSARSASATSMPSRPRSPADSHPRPRRCAGSTEAAQFHDAPVPELHRSDDDGWLHDQHLAVAAK